jgi:hypothetical protein
VGGLDLGRHLGQLEQDRLVLGDRPSEGVPLLRVGDGQLERAEGDAAAAPEVGAAAAGVASRTTRSPAPSQAR